MVVAPDPLTGAQDPGRSYNPGSDSLNPAANREVGSDTVAYSFTSTWRLDAGARRVWAEIERLLRSANPIPWWPAVGAHAANGRITMAVRSVLGYRLQVHAHDIVVRNRSLHFGLAGDLVGEGSVHLVGPEFAPQLLIHMDVVTMPRWMNRTARWLRPAFVGGHHIVMWQGRRRFNRWLTTSEARA